MQAVEIKNTGGPMLIECLTTRWRDHVGPGEDRHFNFRPDEELDNSINNDDLYNLEKLLPDKDVNEIKNKVNSSINDAIDYSEKSIFPDISETTDEVYG